jgi:hypothetical protein
MASAGTVTGSVTLTASFNEFISTGITPYTISETLSALGTLPGTLQFGNGTGSGQIDTLYAAKLSLAAAATTVDFTAVVDPGGGSVTFARGRFFFCYNPSTTAGQDCKIYPGASNPLLWIPGSSSVPNYARYGGGWFMLNDPVSTGTGNGNVITSTSKTVVFDPGANTITVYVIMAGGSVA